MIKKLLVVAALASFAIQAQAECAITHTSASKMVNAVLDSGYGINNYDQVCEKMKKARAAFVISGSGAVLGGKSVAWSNVMLKDKTGNVFTVDYGASTIKMNRDADESTAKALLLEAINESINSMDLDGAIESLIAARKQTSATYARK